MKLESSFAFSFPQSIFLNIEVVALNKIFQWKRFSRCFQINTRACVYCHTLITWNIGSDCSDEVVMCNQNNTLLWLKWTKLSKFLNMQYKWRCKSITANLSNELGSYLQKWEIAHSAEISLPQSVPYQNQPRV